MERKDPLLGLAERVAEEAHALGIETALIGAAALAIHGYARATLDLDLASAVDPGSDLRALEAALRGIGLHTKLNLPDAEDALGGVLNVWEGEDDDVEPVQLDLQEIEAVCARFGFAERLEQLLQHAGIATE